MQIETGEVHPFLPNRHVEVLEVAKGPRRTPEGDRLLAGARHGALHETFGDPGRAIVARLQAPALTQLLEDEARLRHDDLRVEQHLPVGAEQQDAPGPQEAQKAAQPADEALLREVGEERGHGDRVEPFGADEILGPDRGDQPVDAEALLLEAHRLGIDVGDPQPFPREALQEEAGDPAVAAGEIEQPLGAPGSVEPRTEPPGENLGEGVGDAAPGAVVGEEAPVAVSCVVAGEKLQHLVARIEGWQNAFPGKPRFGQQGAEKRRALIFGALIFGVLIFGHGRHDLSGRFRSRWR